MSVIINFLILLIALQHAGFLILEMFFWTKPLGRKIFHLEADFAKRSKALAANQGLYNGFLSAGLFLSLSSISALEALHLQYFFLSCVIIAGIFAGFTVRRRIFYIQAVPAIVALLLLSCR